MGLLSRVLTWPFLTLIRLYQRLLSPLLPPMCRFHPSCSNYGYEAFTLHGPVRGAWLTTHRLCRCHPFNPGGLDPVPGSELERRMRAGELDLDDDDGDLAQPEVTPASTEAEAT